MYMCIRGIVHSQESELLCLCVLGVTILSLPTICLLDFGTVSTVWYFLLFVLLRYFTTIIWQLTFLALYDTSNTHRHGSSLSWLCTIPLTHIDMATHFPGFVQYLGIVQSQESELPCLCVLEVSYKARKVSCHVYVC
jgi:hypothetical protein